MKSIAVTFIKERVIKVVVNGLTQVNGLLVKDSIVIKNAIAFTVKKYLINNSNKLNINSSANFNSIKNIDVINKVDIKNDIHFNSIKKAELNKSKIVYISNVSESKISRLSIPKQVINIIGSINIWNVFFMKNVLNKIILNSKISMVKSQRIITEANKISFKSLISLASFKKLISSVNKVNIKTKIELYKISKIKASNSMVVMTKPIELSMSRLSKLSDYDGLMLSEMDDKTLFELDGIEIT